MVCGSRLFWVLLFVCAGLEAETFPGETVQELPAASETAISPEPPSPGASGGQAAETEQAAARTGAEDLPPAVSPGTADDAAGETTLSRPKLFLAFEWGLSASWVTRIIQQTGRSNFVFQDFLPGLYFDL